MAMEIEHLADVFVEVADTLVADFDVIEFLHSVARHAAEIGGAAAGLMLSGQDGTLHHIGASSEDARLLELFQIQNDEGPCLDCYSTGEVVVEADLRAGSIWPRFAAECTAAGFPSVCAIPLRLKVAILGCLNLFMSEPLRLSDSPARYDPIPDLGADSEAILRELGYGDAEVEDLRRDKVI